MLRILQNRTAAVARTQRQRMMSSATTNGMSELEETDRPSERGLNRVQLLGRVGREPELRGTSEHPCYVFPLATNQSFRRASGDQVKRTDWHRISVFKPSLRDKVVPRIGKGDRVYAEGPLNYSRFTDSDGKNVTIPSIVAEVIIIMSHSNRTNFDEDDLE